MPAPIACKKLPLNFTPGSIGNKNSNAQAINNSRRAKRFISITPKGFHSILKLCACPGIQKKAVTVLTLSVIPWTNCQINLFDDENRLPGEAQ
ncbi:MAG: hypothetical protein K2X93_22590 [Candidatus Obscuribacterales bacterium]|nr:hypothetical protein [Candidatus Obscuribacterales bacterium]